MGMGVMFEFLIPGVEHAEEADLGADVGDGRTVRAVGALIEMPAQGGGATARDGPQHF
jgi:hypothetical protein